MVFNIFKKAVTVILVFVFVFTSTLGGFDKTVFANELDRTGFGEESVLIEETDEYKLYQNSDGSKTITMTSIAKDEPAAPVKEGIVYAGEGGEFAFESKDSTVDVSLNKDLDAGEVTVVIESEGLKLEVTPIINKPEPIVEEAQSSEPANGTEIEENDTSNGENSEPQEASEQQTPEAAEEPEPLVEEDETEQPEENKDNTEDNEKKENASIENEEPTEDKEENDDEDEMADDGANEQDHSVNDHEEVENEASKEALEDSEVEIDTNLENYSYRDRSYEKVVYTDVFKEDIDIEYIPITGGVKENIILNDYTGLNEFSYVIEMQGMTAKKDNDKVFLLNDKGKIEYIISAPYMEDANGEKSYDVDLTLNQSSQSGKFYLKVTADEAWLLEKDRAYPVSIDPTYNRNWTGAIEDNYVKQTEPNKSFPWNWYGHSLGRGYGSGSIYRVFMNPTLPNINNIIVVNAQFSFYVWELANGLLEAAMYPVTSNWDQGNLYWNNQPSHNTSMEISTVNINTKNKRYAMDATAYAQYVYPNGDYRASRDKGVCLKAKRESTNNAYAVMYSSNASSNIITFSMTYNEMVNMPAPDATAYSKGASTEKGYVDLTWASVPNATKYGVAVFNGDEYEIVKTVTGTSWSTDGKGIWPTETEIENGRYKLHADGTGADLATIPSNVYINSPSSTYNNSVEYYFKIIPYNDDGPMSTPSKCIAKQIKLPDAVGPSKPTVTVAPSSYANNNMHLVSWSDITDYDGTSVVSGNIGKIEYKIDTGSWIDTGKTDVAYNNFEIDSSSFADGDHTIYIRAIDTSSNVGEIGTGHIYVDRTGPDSPDITYSTDWVNTSTIPISWTSVSDLRGLNRIEYRVNGSATWLSTGENTSPFSDYALNIASFNNGSNTVDFRAVDTCDNDGDATGITIKVDRTNPSFNSFLSSALAWKNTDSVTLTWQNLSDTYSGLSKLEYKIDSGLFSSLALTDAQKILDVSSYADGSYTATLKATDSAGNTHEATTQIKLDRLKPSNSMIDPSEGDLVKGLVAIWGSSDDTNLLNTTLKASRYSSAGSFIETIDILSSSSSYSNELLGILDTSLYDEEDKVKLELKTTDLAGNISIKIVNIIIDADAIAVDPIININDPIKNETVDETEQRIGYTRQAGAPGTIAEHNLFVDGVFFETETPSHSLKLQSLLYQENSLHDIAVIAKNSNGDFEYSQGLARHSVFVDTLATTAFVGASENIVFSSEGAKLEAGKIAGYLITNPINFLSSDIVYNVSIPSIIPSSTGLTYEISFDNGSNWDSVVLNEDTIITTEEKEVLIKINFSGTSVKTPIAKGIDVSGVKILSKYYVKVKFMSMPENLVVEENKSKYIKIAWEKHADSDVKYNVYRGKSADFAILPENRVAEKIDANVFEDTDVREGVKYFYKVEAYKDFGVNDPYLSKRVSETTVIEVKAYVSPAPAPESSYSSSTEGDGEKNSLTDHIWGDEEEIKAAENANSIYGGDYTVNHDAKPPAGSDEMNESMLGLREVCAAGFEPINFNTGNFFMQTTDAAMPSMPDMLSSITRVYNLQADEGNGPFGNGWAFGYGVHLKVYDNGDVGMIKPDGHLSVFRLGANGIYIDDKDEQHALEVKDAKYVVTNYDGSKYIFTAGGLLEKIISANGNADTIMYDKDGLLKQVKLSNGKEIDFILDAKGHITSIVLPDDKVLEYTYNHNTLTSFKNAAGNITKYVYDNQGRMTEWYDKAGTRQVKNVYDNEDRVIEQWDGNDGYYKLAYYAGYTVTTNAQGQENTFYYDDLGRSTKLVDADGNAQSFEYNAFNLTTKYTDQAGKSTVYDYDKRGNLTKETRPDGRSKDYIYDLKNNLIAESDYKGNWTSYAYDDNGNLTKQANPDGSIYEYEYNRHSQLTKAIDANSNATSYDYRGENLYSVTDAYGDKTYNHYDSSSNLIKTVDANGNATKLAYDALNQLVKATLADGAEIKYQYDSIGNLETMADAYDNVTKYEYDELKNLTKIVNPDGTLVRYAYDKNGNLVKTIEPNGKVITNVYDKKNNLVETKDTTGVSYNYYYNVMGDLIGSRDSNNAFNYLDYDRHTGWIKAVVNPEGNKTSYGYDDNGNVVNITYADGSDLTYAYDEMDRVIKTTLANGSATEFKYDKLGRLAKATDAKGNETSYAYDKLNNLTSVTNALGHKTSFEYDSAGNMTSEIDAMGNRTDYAFDSTNQLKKSIYPKGGIEQIGYDKNGQVAKVIDALGATVKVEYDKMGRVISETDSLGAETKYQYDTAANLVKQTNALGAETKYEYDKRGNIIKIKDAMGGTLAMAYDSMDNITALVGENGFKETYTYDKMGRVTSLADGEGYEKTYSYDKLGRMLREGDNTGKYTTYTYNRVGNITAAINAQKEKTEFLYDDASNLTAVRYADGSYDRFTYDALYNLVKEVDRFGRTTKYAYDQVGNVVSATYPGNVVYAYAYDAEYNLVKETAPDGTKTTYAYDKNGNLVSTTDAQGDTTHMAYNMASMVTKVVDAKGQEAVKVAYNVLGQVEAETDALGNVTRYQYDKLSRLTTVVDPLERITQYQYDKLDNLTTMIDGNGNKTTYAYDTNSRLVSETDALGHMESYTYLKDGLLESVIKPDGTTGRYAYDKAGRLTELSYSDGTTIDYGYNEVGAVTTMIDSTGTSTYQYDKLKRLIATTDSNDKTVKYTYDWQGRKSSTLYPDGKVNSYSYDIMDRLVSVKDKNGIIAEYEYDSVGQLTANRREGLATTYAYDAIGQVEQMVTKDTNQTQIPEGTLAFSYRYDALGNITREERTEDSITTVRKYAYDVANQLTKMREQGYQEQFSYDNAGNMLSKVVNDVTTDYAYNKANQITQETTRTKTIAYIHNQNGDLTSKATGETYTYDAMGNLASIKGNGIDQSYTYNGSGNRLSKTDSGSMISYVNDINTAYAQVLQTYDEQGKLLNTYDYGVERIRSRGEVDETYLYDGTGSVVGVVNPKGEMTTYQYTSYGSLIPSSPTPTSFGYNAEDTDYTTGLQYLRARYYDVNMGRFVQRDEYKGDYTFPKSLNRYVYGNSNPVYYADPSGYRPVEGDSVRASLSSASKYRTSSIIQRYRPSPAPKNIRDEMRDNRGLRKPSSSSSNVTKPEAVTPEEVWEPYELECGEGEKFYKNEEEKFSELKSISKSVDGGNLYTDFAIMPVNIVKQTAVIYYVDSPDSKVLMPYILVDSVEVYAFANFNSTNPDGAMLSTFRYSNIEVQIGDEIYTVPPVQRLKTYFITRPNTSITSTSIDLGGVKVEAGESLRLSAQYISEVLSDGRNLWDTGGGGSIEFITNFK